MTTHAKIRIRILVIVAALFLIVGAAAMVGGQRGATGQPAEEYTKQPYTPVAAPPCEPGFVPIRGTRTTEVCVRGYTP